MFASCNRVLGLHCIVACIVIVFYSSDHGCSNNTYLDDKGSFLLFAKKARILLESKRHLLCVRALSLTRHVCEILACWKFSASQKVGATKLVVNALLQMY